MKNKNRAKKKHLKNLKRKKALQMRQQHQAKRKQISNGVIKMYHFTGRNLIEGIRKYGLCIGHVIQNAHGLGYNAVNLTEEGHYHDMGGSAEMYDALDPHGFGEMSDAELVDMLHRDGMEEIMVLDGEGDLANREEVVAALKDV